MSTTVRRATPADAKQLSDVAVATFALACPPSTTQASIGAFISKNLAETNFDGYLADPDRALFLALDGEAAIGYSMAVFGEPTDPDVVAAITIRPTSELSKLYVLPDHHGAGVSVALVDAAVAEARGRAAAGMWLGVNQQNARANRFYEKSGFERVGTKHFLVGDRYEDDFVRERPL
jgi:ribosomal protein S18 acetylase RimI-like enzyme